MHPESQIKALDHRRCLICAEPVTGITCSRCGHLHRITEHPDAAAIIAFARRHAAITRRLLKERRNHERGGHQ